MNIFQIIPKTMALTSVLAVVGTQAKAEQSDFTSLQKCFSEQAVEWIVPIACAAVKPLPYLGQNLETEILGVERATEGWLSGMSAALSEMPSFGYSGTEISIIKETFSMYPRDEALKLGLTENSPECDLEQNWSRGLRNSTLPNPIFIVRNISKDICHGTWVNPETKAPKPSMSDLLNMSEDN